MDFLSSIGGGVGIAALVGIAVNLRRFWIQSISDEVAREVRHIELIKTMEKQTEALSHLTDKVSGMDIKMTDMDDRLVRVEDHARKVSEVLSRG